MFRYLHFQATVNKQDVVYATISPNASTASEGLPSIGYATSDNSNSNNGSINYPNASTAATAVRLDTSGDSAVTPNVSVSVVGGVSATANVNASVSASVSVAEVEVATAAEPNDPTKAWTTQELLPICIAKALETSPQQAPTGKGRRKGRGKSKSRTLLLKY